MTDVFISYKKEDAGRVVRIVEALRAEGLTVWWDHGIRAGSEWDRSIHEALYSARAVVAIWSEASVHAPWVKEEATVGKSRGVLLPVLIDRVEPPLGFKMIQAADLIGWRGDQEDPRWRALLEALNATLRSEAPKFDRPIPTRPAPRRGLLPLLGGGIAVAALALGTGIYWGLPRGAPPPEPPAAPVPPAAAPAEQRMWDKAMGEKTRQGFQTYLVAYPNGAYAQRARDILLTCRSEQRESWKPSPAVANQMLRGVADTSSRMSEDQACQKAKSDVRQHASSICETIVHNGGFRNARWIVQDRDCKCDRPNPRVTICIADLPYSCMWDMKVQEVVEICG